MKNIFALLVILSFSAAHAAPKPSISQCQRVAEAAALSIMDRADEKGLTDDDNKPRKLTQDERANVTQVDFLNEKDDVVDAETGIYGVQLNVMEECIDGLKVYTKPSTNKKGAPSCKVIKVAPYGDRDCG